MCLRRTQISKKSIPGGKRVQDLHMQRVHYRRHRVQEKAKAKRGIMKAEGKRGREKRNHERSLAKLSPKLQQHRPRVAKSLNLSSKVQRKQKGRFLIQIE